MTTYVMWEGDSLIDGTPIVLLLSINKGGNPNTKTGFMAQTYIVRQDVKPSEAHKQGLDPAVCGDCPMRSPASGGNNACYVNIWRGGNQVWGSYVRGTAKPWFDGLYALIKTGAYLRIGTYGDPAAVPLSVWQEMTTVAEGWTGYTHQWRQPRVQEYADILMASADTSDDRALAKHMGWRTFRVALPDDNPEHGEIRCPASEEAGKKLQCNQCRQCSGNDGRRSKVDVVIKVHGATAKRKEV